jgi:phosphoribosylformylglycinamidine synthase
MIAKIYVTPKKEVLDPQGKAILNSLKSLGFKNIIDLRAGKYFELELSNNLQKENLKEEINEACKKLLANTIIEDYHFEIE